MSVVRYPWTQEHIDLVRRRYGEPGVTPAMLGEILGRTPKQVGALACKLGLRVHESVRGGVRRRVTEVLLALGARPQGVSSRDVPDFSSTTVATIGAVLCTRGMMHRARISHRHVRFFTTAAAAARYMTQHAAPAPNAVNVTIGRMHRHAPWDASAEPVFTERTKWTIAPPPPYALRTNTHSPI